VRDLFDLELRAAPDEPAYEADTVITFEQFVAHELDAPQALPEANFLALDGDRIVGVSRLNADLANAHVLDQGFTGVDPQYRGRGIALTLKLATIDYARAHAFQEIHTQNDSENGPMLHINARLGFVKQPATLIYERRV
jgi:RimJ/RimL family protein N-acetyltransferase